MKLYKTFLMVIATGLLFMNLMGQAQAANSRLTVGVSIVPQASLVKAVGGNFVNVVTMVPPGNSPGNYGPTPQEIQALSQAKLYFTIGVPTEQVNILPKGKELNHTMKIVSLQAEVEKTYEPRYFSPGKRDPHLWLSPKRAIIMVTVIEKELRTIDPRHQKAYHQNAQAYIKKLNQVDRRIKQRLAGLAHKTFIVYHPAFGYFADDYDLKMVALEESGKESSAKNFQELTELAKRENIKTVFYQKEFDNKQAQALAAEIGGRIAALAPLAPDYIENLDKMAKLLANSLK
jgi:zinc transport system substrate-binding protein